MDAIMETARVLLSRDAADPNDTTHQFLKLLADPFGTKIQLSAIYAAFTSSISITLGIGIAFSFLRPYNNVVYAPKLKHADEEHAPPRLGKGVFAWFGPVWSTTEQDLVHLIGMDAAIFLRFTKMCRDLLATLAVVGCAILIPVNVMTDPFSEDNWLVQITPQNALKPSSQWANVSVAWLFSVIICGYLWWNYTKILKLRRQYFESPEYQRSLHARTLMLFDIPKTHASDQGIATIIDEIVPTSSFSRTAIARDVKILPDLIKEHESTVRKLEKVLANYLKDPENLPAARPLCRPSKKDRAYETYPKGQKLDAIEYLTERIKALEIEIKEVRLSVDKRNTMSYGFASYADISEAHSIAHTFRRKKPHGAQIHLAPRPHDIIWDNMPLSAATRSSRRLWNNLWIALLTFLWIAPNAMIAIFLVNLSNLGKVWPAFQTSLSGHTSFWATVQGIASPAITSIAYLCLPIFYRRMSVRAGDQTKTGRERHVTSKLYSFFVFNNLIVFSIFSAIWSFTSTVVHSTSTGTDAWQAIAHSNFGLTVFLTMCSISPFFVTWLLQRQLGAAIDLAQLWPLFYSFIMRKLSNPTPRELIELTAPAPFDYASYYNYFLYYTTVTLCYAPIQPLVLPAAALYFFIDVPLKKYLLMYIFVTKTESGGMFWRMLFNRMVFAAILSQLVMFLVVWVRGDPSHMHAYAVAPLPLLMIAFKLFCGHAFDNKIYFYTTQHKAKRNPEAGLTVKEESLRNDRLAAKFGHPALYKPLITPMVHAKAQNKLASVYMGRLTDGREAGSGDMASVSGYSDTYVMDQMAKGKPGKLSGVPGFELVPESRLDFEFYKNRDDFVEDAGDLVNRNMDFSRPGTAGTMVGGSASDTFSRPGTPAGGMGFAGSRNRFASPPPLDGMAGTTYPRGYVSPPQDYPTAYTGQTTFSGPGAQLDVARTRSPLYTQHSNDSITQLVGHAANMATAPPMQSFRPGTPASSNAANSRAPSHGYGVLVEDNTPSPEDAARFDYFRGNRRNPRDHNSPGAATRGPSGPWTGN